MKILQGEILKKDQVVLGNLQCNIQFHTGIGGIKSWAGRFHVPSGQSITPGEYRLGLENGWTGMISITKVISGEAHFLGVGTLE